MIVLNDFKKEYSLLKEEIDDSVARVLKSGYFILGKEVKTFEDEFAKYLDLKYCVGVGNGTDAINLSLRACGIKRGDEVITTCLTAFPTITGIIEAGGVPVLVDVDKEYGLIDPEKISEKITSKTRFIIPVHLYGQCADISRIIEISEKHDLKIIEDCAQATGAEYKGKKAGNFGIASAFSFYPTKNLGAFGDGGAVVTDDGKIYERLLMLRNYGQKDRYSHGLNGINSRLDEIQAAILRVKLKRIEENINKRRKIAIKYDRGLKIDAIKERPGNRHTYHLYVIRSRKRKELQRYLEEKAIQSLVHYPIPVYKQRSIDHKDQDHFPNTDRLTGEVLSIPVNGGLSSNETDLIIESINDFFKSHEKI